MSKSDESQVSICDVMKGNTSEIIRKMEEQIPSFVQQYSDLYGAYLHLFDDVFGTCYISEKEFFDRLNIDKRVLQEFKNYSDVATKIYSNSIELSSRYLQAHVQMRISTLKSCDEFLHVMMNTYAKNYPHSINGLIKILQSQHDPFDFLSIILRK